MIKMLDGLPQGAMMPAAIQGNHGLLLCDHSSLSVYVASVSCLELNQLTTADLP